MTNETKDIQEKVYTPRVQSKQPSLVDDRYLKIGFNKMTKGVSATQVEICGCRPTADIPLLYNITWHSLEVSNLLKPGTVPTWINL